MFLTHIARAAGADDATRDAAKTLGYAGVEAFQAGHFADASERLEKAYALLKAPSLGLWSARALAKTGRLIQASDRYLEVMNLKISTGDRAVQKKAQQDAAREHAELAARIPTVHVAVVGADAGEVSVTIDDAPVTSSLDEPIPIDPGKKVIEGRYGEETTAIEVTLAEGQRETIELRFSGTSPPPLASMGADSGGSGSTRRTLGWVTLGVGSAGVAVGTVFGLSAFGERKAMRSSNYCNLEHNACTDEEQGRVDSYNTKRVLSSVGLIGGGLLAATGVYLVFFGSESTGEAPAVGLELTPGSVSMLGRF